MTSLECVQSVLAWLGSDPAHVVVAASAVAALTPTPNPGTPAGKVYKMFELLALNFLRAKETGVTVDSVAEQVAALLEKKAAISTPTDKSQ